MGVLPHIAFPRSLAIADQEQVICLERLGMQLKNTFYAKVSKLGSA
jgi:hypothetical protein